MSINQYFKKRVLIGLAVGLVALVIGGLGQMLGPNDHMKLEQVGFLLFLAALLLVIFIRCPSCKTVLGMQCTESLRRNKSKSNFNFCPKCGIEFSEHEYKP
jgi:hypothetical protein